MPDLPHDFGTGLRAHLGLEQEELELLAESISAPEEHVPDESAEPEPEEREDVSATLETLIAFEHELLERERELARRETALAGRAGALLAAARSLHDEVLGGTLKPRDELARMRRRKSGAA